MSVHIRDTATEYRATSGTKLVQATSKAHWRSLDEPPSEHLVQLQLQASERDAERGFVVDYNEQLSYNNLEDAVRKLGRVSQSAAVQSAVDSIRHLRGPLPDASLTDRVASNISNSKALIDAVKTVRTASTSAHRGKLLDLLLSCVLGGFILLVNESSSDIAFDITMIRRDLTEYDRGVKATPGAPLPGVELHSAGKMQRGESSHNVILGPGDEPHRWDLINSELCYVTAKLALPDGSETWWKICDEHPVAKCGTFIVYQKAVDILKRRYELSVQQRNEAAAAAAAAPAAHATNAANQPPQVSP